MKWRIHFEITLLALLSADCGIAADPDALLARADHLLRLRVRSKPGHYMRRLKAAQEINQNLASFVSQSDQWIDARGSSRGKVACGQRRSSQEGTNESQTPVDEPQAERCLQSGFHQ
jgi:hypothetical protein